MNTRAARRHLFTSFETKSVHTSVNAARRSARATTRAGFIMSLVGIASLHAQSFEAASIKPTQMTGLGASIDRRPGMLMLRNATLQDCIREAYGVTDPQISGEKWLSPDRYDIVAKIPPGVTS